MQQRSIYCHLTLEITGVSQRRLTNVRLIDLLDGAYRETDMGLFDYVNFEMACPKCGAPLHDFQTKDGDVYMNTVEIEAVTSFYTACPQCKHWVELTRVPPPDVPVTRKAAATLDDAKALGFRLLDAVSIVPPNARNQRR